MTVNTVKATSCAAQAAIAGAMSLQGGSADASMGKRHMLRKALCLLEACFVLAVTIVIAFLVIRFSIHWIHPFSM